MREISNRSLPNRQFMKHCKIENVLTFVCHTKSQVQAGQLVGRAYLKAVSEASTTGHATSRTCMATLVRLSLQKV